MSGHSEKSSEEAETHEGSASAMVREGTPAFGSLFAVPKMDCPSEEQIIRMALEDIEPPVILKFDTPNRRLSVFHTADVSEESCDIFSLLACT